MKLSPEDQESILALIARTYNDILAIEEQFKLLVGGGDYRARIDYFHDAIRAYTSGDTAHREKGGRLNVEFLAYDLTSLRYIQSMPLASFKPHEQHMGSPDTGVISMGSGQELATVKQARPDRKVREQLAELYQTYAVMYAALLKPFADNDYHDRIDDLMQDNAELKALKDQLAALADGKGSLNEAANLANHVNDDNLQKLMITFLQQKRYKNREDTQKLMAALKLQQEKNDKEIRAIEDAHLSYATGQLAVYEGSKDMLKKMASQGMNLVGKFVEASINATRSDMGRGNR